LKPIFTTAQNGQKKSLLTSKRTGKGTTYDQRKIVHGWLQLETG
jgi:hypothetical protein